MSLTRRDLLFWIAAVVIILGALAAAQIRHTSVTNHTMFLLGLVGGLIVFRVGVQVIWAGMRSRRKPRLWIGAGISLAGLCLVYLGLYPR